MNHTPANDAFTSTDFDADPALALRAEPVSRLDGSRSDRGDGALFTADELIFACYLSGLVGVLFTTGAAWLWSFYL